MNLRILLIKKSLNFSLLFSKLKIQLHTFITFVLLFLPILNHSLFAMQLHECCVDLFAYDTEHSEYLAYLKLKKNPLTKDVNYLAVPWHGAHVTHNIERIESELTEKRLSGGFTVCYEFEKVTLFRY